MTRTTLPTEASSCSWSCGLKALSIVLFLEVEEVVLRPQHQPGINKRTESGAAQRSAERRTYDGLRLRAEVHPVAQGLEAFADGATGVHTEDGPGIQVVPMHVGTGTAQVLKEEVLSAHGGVRQRTASHADGLLQTITV